MAGIIEVSEHLVRLYHVLDHTHWQTNRELAKAAGLNQRTVRAHTKSLADAGVLGTYIVFGGTRFRLVRGCEHLELVKQIETAADVLGLAPRARKLAR
jgi:DNA-binding transcriptional ArsR family regulator